MGSSMLPQSSSSCSATPNNSTAPNYNTLFWACVAFALCHWLFARILRAVLLRAHVAAHRCAATVLHAWHGVFSAAAVCSLSAYYYLQMADKRRWIYGSGSALMTTTSGGGGGGFGTLLIGFYASAAGLTLNAQDYREAVSMAGFAVVLHILQSNGLEHFTVMLSIWMSVYHLITAIVHTVALHARPSNVRLHRSILAVRLLTWCYVYLHMLPFDFLVPVLYARAKPSVPTVWLNVCLWLWYGTGIWQSPVLLYCYYRLFRPHRGDDGGSAAADSSVGAAAAAPETDTERAQIARNVLVRRSPEYQHYVSLQTAYAVVKMAQPRVENMKRPSASRRALQTVKSMMTLKRKLKRIRESKAAVPSVAVVS